MIAVVVYLGLLPALLFSSAEGIRLVPFPDPSHSSEEKPAERSEPGIRYQENATHIFREGGAKKPSQNQKLPNHYAGPLSCLDHGGLIVVPKPSSEGPKGPLITFSDRELSGVSGRAPPLV